MLLLCGSCNEKIFTADVDCKNCTIDKPEYGEISVSVTISYKYPGVVLTIYSGDINDNNVVAIDTAYSSPFYFYLPVDRKYSVSALYKNNDGTRTYAVDAINFKTQVVSDACDARCYVISNDKLDVRIRKQFQ